MSFYAKVKALRDAVDALLEEFDETPAAAETEEEPLVPLDPAARTYLDEVFPNSNAPQTPLKAPSVPKSWMTRKDSKGRWPQQKKLRELLAYAALHRLTREELYQHIERTEPHLMKTLKDKKRVWGMVTRYIRDGKLVEGRGGKLRVGG